MCVTLRPSLLVSDNEAIIEFSGAEMKNVGEQLETGLFWQTFVGRVRGGARNRNHMCATRQSPGYHFSENKKALEDWGVTRGEGRRRVGVGSK